MGEHRAEIVADEAITKVTTPETWGEAMAALLTEVKAGRPGDGIVAAVELIGDGAGRAFPAIGDGHQRNPGQADRAMSDDRDARSRRVGGQIYPRVTRGRWEYVERCGGVHAVVILAEHDGKVVLIEQSRVPLGGRCLELPAGLVGDEDEQATVEETAIKELEEETGFTPSASSGSASSTARRAWSRKASRWSAPTASAVGDGGGNEHEEIEVHLVPRADIPAFVRAEAGRGRRDRRQAAAFPDFWHCDSAIVHSHRPGRRSSKFACRVAVRPQCARPGKFQFRGVL